MVVRKKSSTQIKAPVANRKARGVPAPFPKVPPPHEHPMIAWFICMFARDWAELDDGDILVSPAGAARFGIATEDMGNPRLVIADPDVEAFRSIDWRSAAMIRNYHVKDWIALACPDIRVPMAAADDPVRLRIMIPMSHILADAWDSPKGKKPDELVICERDEREIARLPLTLKGFNKQEN
jgi:hypothetical protein